jgi:hypothetical protein
VILWKMVHTPNWQSRWQSDPDGVKDVWGLVSLHQKEPRWLLHPSANGVRCQLKKMVMACHGNGSYWRRGQKERAIAIKDFYLKILRRGFKGSVHLYAGFLKWGYPKIIQSSKILYYWLYICVCVCIYIYGKTNGLGHPHFRTPSYVFFWIRVTAPGEGHGEGEIEVTGKDEYGVYEAGGFVRGRTMTDWWISTCFNIFQPRVQEAIWILI